MISGHPVAYSPAHDTTAMQIENGRQGWASLLMSRYQVMPPAHSINEPVHGPSATAGHEGWLMVFVYDQTGNVAAGPVAKIAAAA
jgi:hypothetical protein